MITDETDETVWEGIYKPFGRVDVTPKSKITNNLRFPGQYYDNETGFHYNYHRYYSPYIGRYLSSDPIGLKGDSNLFVYARNNPIRWVDPFGLEVIYNGNMVTAEVGENLEALSSSTGYDINITSGARYDNPFSQHYGGNAADFYMTDSNGAIVDMGEAAYATADYDGDFNGFGYYSGEGIHGAHVHADCRSALDIYWSETDYSGYDYNYDSSFWSDWSGK